MDKDYCLIDACQWDTECDSRVNSFPITVRVLTWNLLAPCYKRTSYGRESSHVSDWTERQRASLDTIIQNDSDVVFLQEVWFEKNYFETLCSVLASVYHIYYCQRVHGKQDGLAILLKKEVIPKPYTFFGVDFYDFGSRIALVLEWEKLIMVNTHLTFPHNNKYDRLLRLSQAKDLIQVVNSYSGKKVVLAGDCNGSIDDEAVQLLISELSLVPMVPHTDFCSHISHRGDKMACDLMFSSHIPMHDVVIHPIQPTISDHACVEAKFQIGTALS